MPITYIPHEDSIRRWPAFVDLIGKIPATRDEVTALFGDPRLLGANGKPLGEPDTAWEKAYIVERQGLDAIPGIPPRFYFKCHRLIEPYLREGLRRARVVCPGYKIHRAGGYVYRHIKHDPKKALSLHSWGIAIDFNPDDNKAIQFDRKEDVPEFFSPGWAKIWPHGMPREFVDAMISVGFTWGGAFSTYPDPMHFQLASCG